MLNIGNLNIGYYSNTDSHCSAFIYRQTNKSSFIDDLNIMNILE
jgi:hypothetical protein